MSLRSPLARARGHGSAEDGVGHWWHHRVTSVALVPLLLWLAFSIAALAGASFEEARAWLASPVVAVFAILTLAVTFYHFKLGLDVVIEDYVYGKGRSEEHTSELQSHSFISYAVFCLKKKTKQKQNTVVRTTTTTKRTKSNTNY